MSVLFDAQFYLAANPDVADAVSKGVFTAEEHFQLYGKFENRAPSAFFDPDLYLAANPDVAAALQIGAIKSAYQHFLDHGLDEGRDPTLFFNSAFYLATNPDVDAAVQSGVFASAFEHFLQYGAQEARDSSPFFDIDSYLDANPDVAAAVQAGYTTAYDHFITYGFKEGRDLGNGISLEFFGSDPVAQQAIDKGDFGALFARVAEVSPFIESFQPPAGYAVPSNQPIPNNFVPNEGDTLVIPEGVTPPADQPLPPSFSPVTLFDAEGGFVGSYSTLQAAEDAADEGYRIEVSSAAKLTGDLTVNVEGLIINGNGAQLLGGVYFQSTSTGSELNGFNIDGTFNNPTTEGATIFIQANGIIISNNTISGVAEGRAGIITTGGLSSLVISDNSISGYSGYGIFLNPNSEIGAVVTGNTFEDNRYGVLYQNDAASNVTGNSFSGSTVADIGAWYTDGGIHDVSDVVSGNTHLDDAPDIRIISANGNEVIGTDADDLFVASGLGDDAFNGGLGQDTMTGAGGNNTLLSSLGGDLYKATTDTEITFRLSDVDHSGFGLDDVTTFDFSDATQIGGENIPLSVLFSGGDFAGAVDLLTSGGATFNPSAGSFSIIREADTVRTAQDNFFFLRTEDDAQLNPDSLPSEFEPTQGSQSLVVYDDLGDNNFNVYFDANGNGDLDAGDVQIHIVGLSNPNFSFEFSDLQN